MRRRTTDLLRAIGGILAVHTVVALFEGWNYSLRHNLALGPPARSWNATTLTASPASSHTSDQLVCTLEDGRAIPETFPTTVVIGAQKAGTSALYQLLQQHPRILVSKGKEPHFFDKRGEIGHDASVYTPADVCEARRQYAGFFDSHQFFNMSRPQPVLTFEKTPSYMVYSYYLAHLMQTVCPSTQIVVMLRNPVDRLYSSYIGDDFEGTVASEIARLVQVGWVAAPPLSNWTSTDTFAMHPRLRHARHQKSKLAASGVARGMYAVQLEHWLRAYDRDQIHFFCYEHFQRHPQAILNRLLTIMGAEAYEFTNLDYIYGPNPNAKLSRPLMRRNTRDYLTRFYQPFNDRLRELLGDRFECDW